MIAYTDHHITEFGDKPHLPAPIRQVEVVAFDGASHLIVDIGMFRFELRRSNVYKEPGRLGQQPCLSTDDLLMGSVWVPHQMDWEDVLDTTPDTIDMCVLYWPDGTWCYECDYDERDYTHMSDDIGRLNVSTMLDYEQVDALVRMACITGGINVPSST